MMSHDANTAIRFARIPEPGPLAADVFELVEDPVPALAEGECLVRTIYLSIDAGSRAQLDDRGDYVFKARVGTILGCSGIVGQVVESRNPAWHPGDLLVTTRARCARYQKLAVTPGQFIHKVIPGETPLAAHLGILGMVGFTAYIGMLDVGQPKAGETVLVSAAAGATGSIAGQFAKIAGARVVGIAGGEEKCRLVIDELGFDDCIDYKHGDIRAKVAAACPAGVDVYYENVGGEIQKAAFAAMNNFGRIAMCGQIGQYSGTGEAPGPNLMCVVLKRLTIRGFLVRDHMDRHGEFLAKASDWYREGRLRHHATITRGLENFHEAINSLTTGRNIGKQLCQVVEEPLA